MESEKMVDKRNQEIKKGQTLKYMTGHKFEVIDLEGELWVRAVGGGFTRELDGVWSKCFEIIK